MTDLASGGTKIGDVRTLVVGRDLEARARARGRAMFLPFRRATSVLADLAAFNSAASRSKKRLSAGLSSSSVRMLRPLRLIGMHRVSGVVDHSPGAAAGPPRRCRNASINLPSEGSPTSANS